MNKYEEAISTCSNLIYAIIKKHFKGYDIEDLYQVGIIGVIKAFNNYKMDKNTKFSTYAYKYIYGEIYLYINNSRIIKNARENYTLYKKINEAKNALSQRLMKEPSIHELSLFLEIEENVIAYVINSMNKVDSLDRTVFSDDKDVALFDIVSDNKDYYNIDYLLLNDEIQKLPEDERRLIYMRYFEDKSQNEVADILGITQVGVSRTEKKTLQKIRSIYQNVA